VNAPGFATLTDLSTGASSQLPGDLPAPSPVVTDTEIDIPPDAVPITGATTSILNPAVGPGAAPLVAWTRYRLDHLATGTTGATIDLRVHRPGAELTLPHAANQVFGHPSVFGANLVSFEAVSNGAGDIYATDSAGHISRNLPQVNTSADEREPAWTADGRYMAFVRRGADGHQRILLFDFANNLLVNPTGLDLGVPLADNRPLGESLALQGGISVADDATARTFTSFLRSPQITCKPGFVQCTVTGSVVIPLKTTTVGILARRVLGTTRALGRTVPKLGPQIRLPLGSHRGPFHVSRSVRGVKPGRYLLTLRTFDARGEVSTLAAPRVVTVR
jgi:hypothetical protein